MRTSAMTGSANARARHPSASEKTDFQTTGPRTHHPQAHSRTWKVATGSTPGSSCAGRQSRPLLLVGRPAEPERASHLKLCRFGRSKDNFGRHSGGSRRRGERWRLGVKEARESRRRGGAALPRLARERATDSWEQLAPPATSSTRPHFCAGVPVYCELSLPLMGHVSAHPMLDFLPLSPPKQYGARSTARDVGNIGTDKTAA